MTDSRVSAEDVERLRTALADIRERAEASPASYLRGFILGRTSGPVSKVLAALAVPQEGKPR